MKPGIPMFALLVPFICGCAGPRQDTPAHAPAFLPSAWAEKEGTYDGVWTRRGSSNTYDATWTRGGEVVTEIVAFEWIHDGVIAFRRQNAGGRYVGVLSPDGKSIKVGAMDWSADTWSARPME